MYQHYYAKHINQTQLKDQTFNMYLILTLIDPPRPGPAQRPAHIRGIRIGVQGSARSLVRARRAWGGCASTGAPSLGSRGGGGRGGGGGKGVPKNWLWVWGVDLERGACSHNLYTFGPRGLGGCFTVIVNGLGGFVENSPVARSVYKTSQLVGAEAERRRAVKSLMSAGHCQPQSDLIPRASMYPKLRAAVAIPARDL